MTPAVFNDFIVVGSGIAGLTTALGAAEHGNVLLLTKGTLLESNTFFAQGGIAAALAPGDTPESHSLDTLLAGAEMCEPEAVTVLVEGGPGRIRDLIKWGTRFDTTSDGTLAFGREAAHSIPRILHARGDATGAEIASVLAANVKAHPKIRVVEHATILDLIISHGRCVGCWILLPDHTIMSVLARACVLATGGCGQLYQYTTNPWVASGDGVAVAYRAGATLIDMEFIQFHPTALAVHENPMFLISEAVRGEGAILVDETGRRFMEGIHPQKELAPRDVVARAIFAEMQKGHTVYLDATSIGERFATRFPTITRACQEKHIDPITQPIQVTPAMHFIMGGIETDTSGRTSLPGLYACGEAACTGVHGANRLASNSLLEGLVFSERITQALSSEPLLPSNLPTFAPIHDGPEVEQPDLENQLKRIMWDDVGLVRTESGLGRAEAHLEALAKEVHPQAYRLKNLLDTGLSVVRGSRVRTESRGGHFRQDYPVPNEAWRMRRVVQRIDLDEPMIRQRTSGTTSH